MKESTSSNKFYLLGILVVFVLAYLPLNSFLFALKNDMFTGYLAPKFIMGEAIHSNQLPLWNPYISFGLPFYGDMSASYWSPLTWLIAATSGYNPYTLTIEVLLYLLLSGIGMYYLSGCFAKNKYIRLIAAISYMCNGYIVGHLQHINWLSGAAYLPFCLWSLEKLHSERSLKWLLLSSLFFYLLLSSSHPGISIGAIYFFAAYIISKLLTDFKQHGLKELLKSVKLNLLFAGCLLLLSAGLIIGYADIIPYFDRNQAVDLSLSLNQNTDLKSWISGLLPFATTGDDIFFRSDPAFRNIYFGLILFVLFIASLFNKKSKKQVFFLVAGSFFLLLSLGGLIKLFTSKFIPLLGHVRVNAEFRIFAILCFTSAAVIFFNSLLEEKDYYQKKLKTVIVSVIAVLSFLFLYGFINLLMGKESALQYISTAQGIFFNRDVIKEMLDAVSIYDALLIQSIIQITLLLLLLNALRKNQMKRIFLIAATDIILATLLNLPFTGVGRVSVSTVSAILKKSPPGIPTPSLQPVRYNDTLPLNEVRLIGVWSFYSKQPGSAKADLYPVKLINNYSYYLQAAKDTTLRITDMPFVYISDSIQVKKPKKIKALTQENIVSYKTGELHLKLIADSACYIVLLQNYYPHWYYKINGQTYPVLQAGINFIGIPLEKGENDVRIFFNPIRIKTALLFSSIVFILYILVLFIPRLRKASLLKQQE
ncbi:YfhO family protein [Lacibacter sediminis]|uniref:YfhO family protein n=2 Tax=Lacibacter sediminis TaxID=2760713 RepID=A0A7G5XK14_9BACT|nr:YfhO family protein [Lacibacter sediminis]